LRKGEILLLDNVRFMAEEMTMFETKLKLSREEQAKTIVVRKLAPLADLYVCDAFAALHRSQPTLVGFEELLPSAMGRLFEREMTALGNIAENPAHPCVYILGGAKIQDAFLMMGAALSSGAADVVLTGGLVSNIMLMAKGIDIGQASMDFIKANNLMDFVSIGKDLLSNYADKIILPKDLACVVDGSRTEADITGLLEVGLLVDIGTKTVEAYKEYIGRAKTVFINGPMGVFEKPETEFGTREIWNASANSSAYSVIGGGDSVTAANKFELADKFSYVSTGGGALVQFLSGTEQPVIAALKASAKKFKAHK
jgi:phosphoglycerate kinase